MILAFNDIRMVWCLNKNSVIFLVTTGLHSWVWSMWDSIKQPLQIRRWCFLQNLRATCYGWVSQKIRGTWIISSIYFLTCLLGPSLTGISTPSGAQWSEWQNEQSNYPLITSSLFSLLIMRVSTHSRQAVSWQHIIIIGYLFLRLK